MLGKVKYNTVIQKWKTGTMRSKKDTEKLVSMPYILRGETPEKQTVL